MTSIDLFFYANAFVVYCDVSRKKFLTSCASVYHSWRAVYFCVLL